MSLEKLTAREMVFQAGMSKRPEFYSGRGATLSDLNSEILEKIYKSIKKEYGEKPSKQFVKMINDLPVASATDFLLNLYKLESNNWKWSKEMLGKEKGIYVDGPTDESKFAVGMMTIAGVLGGSMNNDNTQRIKGYFLINHGIISKEKLKSDNKTIDYIY